MNEVKLTDEMRKCLSIIDAHGIIERHKGGFWCQPDISVDKFGCPVGVEWVGKGTIVALEKRGLIAPCESKESRHGLFHTKYKRTINIVT
jgi:hypothetical protein